MPTQRNSLNDKALGCFVLVDEKNQKYSCKIGNCDRTISGKNTANLVSHIKHVHFQFYIDKINTVAADVKSIELKRLELIQACVEIVTVNGRPFKFLVDSGFQLAISDKLRVLAENGRPFVVDVNNFAELKEYIKKTGKEILAKIQSESKHKLVSIMTDIGSKNDRAILGTYIRYNTNNKVVTRNIGMTAINNRHKSPMLKQMITDQMSKVGVSSKQLITFTSDNANNMIATANLLDAAANLTTVQAENDENEIDEEDEDDYGDDDNDGHDGERRRQQFSNNGNVTIDEVNAIVREIERHEEIDENLEALLDDNGIEDESERYLEEQFAGQTLNIHRIPCAAHTLQLAVKDFLNTSVAKTLVSLCRIAAKEMRRPALIYDLKASGIQRKKVRLDCSTRWSSVHQMVISANISTC